MKSGEEIDELLAGLAPPVRKPNTKRKGTSALKASEHTPSGDLPSIVEGGTRAYNIAQRIVAGMPISAIAEEYGLPQSDIKAVITTAMEEVFEQTAPIFANFAMVSMNRFERIIEGLIPRMFNEDDSPNETVIELFRKIYADQKDLALMVSGAGSKRSTPALPDMSETMASSSKLYHESMDALRSRKYGESPEREADIKDLDDLFKNDGIIQDAGRSTLVRPS